MYRLWEPIIGPVIEALDPAVITEIGSDRGYSTQRILDSSGVPLVQVVDPNPKYDVDAWGDRYGDRFAFQPHLSLNAIPRLQHADLVLIDGDHNYYTVLNELRALERLADENDRDFPTVLLHDVGWPYGRRDLYYDPTTIPEAHRHAHRQAGVLPGRPEPVDGAGLNAHLENAVYEGTPGNGVLTAVEDFVVGTDRQLDVTVLPGIHGCAIVCPVSLSSEGGRLHGVLTALRMGPNAHRLLQTVEDDRLAQEVRFVEERRRSRDAVTTIETLRQRLAAEQDALADAVETAQRRQAEREAAVERAARDSAEREALAEQLEAARGELRAQTTAREAAVDELHAAAEAQEQALTDLATVRSELDAVASSRSGALAEIERLRGEHAAASRARDEAEQRAARARREFERLRQRRSVKALLAVVDKAHPAVVAYRRVRKRLAPAPQPQPLPQRVPQTEAEPAQLQLPPAVVDIVVCVHNAHDDVARCLTSIAEHTSLDRHHLIIVDDGSDPLTRDLCRAFASEVGASLVRSETGSGYCVAANRGLRASTAPYVVLLNSDTIVGPRWLDQLLAAARSEPDVAVVGPLSNAASWQSIPELTEPDGSWKVNELPDGVDVSDVATALTGASPRLYPRVPLVNGFCYLITRHAIDRVGLLDEESFPRGYGEEDDLSIRCLDAGMHHLVADDTFVFHAKSRSYTAAGRAEIVKVSKERLREKHGEDRLKQLVRDVARSEELARARAYAALVVEDLERSFAPPDLSQPALRVGWLQPHLGTVGGIRRTIEMTNRLVAWGADVSILTPDGERTDWLAMRADVRPIDEVRDEVFDVLIVSDPDMIEAFDGLKATARVNYHLAPYSMYRPAGPALDAYYARRDDTVHVTNSTWTAELVTDAHGLEVAGTFPGGVDRRQFHPVRTSPTHDIVCYGSRRPHKGTDTIIDAAGDRSLLRLAPLNLRQSELAANISRGRVLASACWHEGFNFVPLEAMACGVPVVMTDDGGSREYAVDGHNAIVVPPRDPAALAAGLDRVLGDPELRRNLLVEGLRTAWRYDWDTTTAAFARLLLDA